MTHLTHFRMSHLKQHRQEMYIRSTKMTQEQFEVVRNISQEPTFDFTCMGPIFFKDDKRKKGYKGPFVFIYYTKDDTLHRVRIGKTGKILRHISVGKKGVVEVQRTR